MKPRRNHSGGRRMIRRITACGLFLSDVRNAEVKTRVVIQRIPRFDITVVINAGIILNQLRLMRINDLLLLRSNDPIVKKCG
jgi:hypothetical protein